MSHQLSDSKVLEIVRGALQKRGTIEFHPHADAALADEGFDVNDARNAIKLGKVTRREPDMRGEERITIEGPPVDQPGKSLGLVVKIRSDEPPDVLVITAFDENTRYGRRRR